MSHFTGLWTQHVVAPLCDPPAAQPSKVAHYGIFPLIGKLTRAQVGAAARRSHGGAGTAIEPRQLPLPLTGGDEPVPEARMGAPTCKIADDDGDWSGPIMLIMRGNSGL